MIELEAILAAQAEWQAARASGPDSQRQLAAQAFDGCRAALQVLGQNLKASDYPWVRIETVPPAELTENVRRIERVIGASIPEASLPEILVLFWQRIGGVALIDLESYRHVDFWERRQINSGAPFCDGLYIEACSQAWADFVCADYLDWGENWPPESGQPFLLSLSPDGYHKDNISGGAPYGLCLGEPWTPVWQNFEWAGPRRPESAPPGEPDFLSYLRTCVLECAGFPGLLGQPAFEALRPRLLEAVPLF